jgi:hypothetical protein
MKLVDFPERNIVLAKDQPEYLPLPAHITTSQEHLLTCCWQLTWRERLRVLFGGVVWHQIMTFGQQLQPQKLMTEKPELEK